MEYTFIFGSTRLLASCVYFLICGLSASKKSHMAAFSSLKYYAFLMGLWDFFLGAYYVAPSIKIAALFLPLVYHIVPFTSLFFFYFAFTYTYPDKAQKNKKLLLLAIIPLISSILALTSNYHNLFITYGGEDSVFYNPFREITETYHFWFYIHSAYSYLLVIAGVIVLFFKLKNLKLHNKTECIFVIIIAIVYITTNFLATFIDKNFSLWITLILKLFCIISLYLALSTDEAEIIRFKGQINLIQSLPIPIFFLNSSDRIIYANIRAIELCPFAKSIAREEHLKDEIFTDFIDYTLEYPLKLKQSNTETINSVLQSKSTGDIYFLQNEVINYGRINKKSGNMLIFLTFSSIETVFSSLEDKAFKDPLCNNYNRHFLELKKVEFKQKETCPIAFIMCDIDSLKQVNDKYGHNAGDEYILLCNTFLRKNIRNSDYIFRLGGDEFLIIIPNAGENIARKVSASIQEDVNNYPQFKDQNLGMSIGYSVAETLPIDFDRCIKEADNNMYKNKRNRKKSLTKIP